MNNLNDIVMRRNAARVRAGTLPGALGDYPADLPNRVFITKGVAEAGPIDTPVISPATGTSDIDLLTQIRDLLVRLPAAMSDEWRTKFVMLPREALSFIAPAGPVSVPAGASIAVVSQIVNQNFTGFLTHVGVNVLGAGGFADVNWQIRVNGSIHPLFTNDFFAASTLATPLPFSLELVQNRTVQLVASNNGAVAHDVVGVLVGWTEFLAQGKRYGATPSTNVA
jgi:hypothetical protein